MNTSFHGKKSLNFSNHYIAFNACGGICNVFLIRVQCFSIVQESDGILIDFSKNLVKNLKKMDKSNLKNRFFDVFIDFLIYI